MDTSTAATPTRSSAPGAASSGAPRRGAPPRGVVPELGPGWLALRDCALGGDGPRVGLALLHPGVGVALVDFEAKGTDAAAVDRLRRALDARRFPAIFGGYPPIVRAVLPPDRRAELGRVLAEAFAAHPPLALSGGDAWIGTARAAIEAEMPAAVPERLRAKQRRASPWRVAALAAAAGGAFAATAFALVVALPGHDGPATAAHRPAVLASATATGGALAPSSREAEPADDELTALDVAAALASAEVAAGAAAAKAALRAPAPAPAPAADGGRPEPAPVAPTTASPREPEPAPPVVAEARGASEAAPGRRTSADAVAGAPAAAPPADAGGAPAAEAAATGGAAPEAAPPASFAAEAPAASVAGLGPAPRSAPHAADAATESRPPPRRTPAPVAADAPTRTATVATGTAQAPAGGGRRSASSVAADAGVGGRCREVLVRATMGEALTAGDREFLRRGCQPRG